MIDILSMVDDSPPERQSKTGTTLYGSGGFLAKDPKYFNRNEKLTFIEHQFAILGQAADVDSFVMECRTSRGLSLDSYQKARDYGLYLYKG